MRIEKDAAIDAIGGTRPRSSRGGKVLQRLFYFAGRRDPSLNDDVISWVPTPKAIRPSLHLTPEALTAPAGTAVRQPGTRRQRPNERLAAALVDAASALSEAERPQTAGAPPSPTPIWEWLGPTVIPNGQTYGTNKIDVIGRVACVAIDPSNPQHILCGGAGGGIWESSDGGTTWAPRTDQMPSLTMGAIAFDPSNPRIVYAGSGEGNFYWFLGAGVYQSADGGTTWRVLAAAPFVGAGFFNLIVDSSNSQTLYAATTSGFYTSTNAGTSWTQRRGGPCWDISVHPMGGPNAEILATFPDGLFVSTNRGTTFNSVALPSAPNSAWTRLAVCRVVSSPDIVYVFGAAGAGAYLWRRTGTTWRRITGFTPKPTQMVPEPWKQAQYDWYVAVPPDNPNQVYLGAIEGYRGELTGSTWRWTNFVTNGSNSIHPDQHCLVFEPGNSRTIYAGSDGGLFRSTDSGATWAARNTGLGITEVEYIDTDPNTPNWVMAGLQDNGTIRFTGTPAWTPIAPGDGGDCAVNPLNPSQIYHSYYGVSLERSDDKGNHWTDLQPPGVKSLFYPPVCVYGQTVVIAASLLVVSRTSGAAWATIGFGLSAGDMPTASCIRDADNLYVATARGSAFRIAWNGTNWASRALASPFSAYISCIAIDPNNPQRLWVTSSQVTAGAALVYRSDSGGATWIDCTVGLPANVPKNSVVVDPTDGNRVWVAADVGVYQSTDAGATWVPFATGLPNAMAVDLHLHNKDRKLLCATRNRGVWSISVS